MAKDQRTIVFFSMESEGHLNSVKSTMRELQRRGHKLVVMLMKPYKVEKLTDEGFQVEIVEENGVESEEKLVEMMSDLSRFKDGPKKTFAGLQPMIVGMYKEFNAHYDLIKNKLEELKPDLVVVDHLMVCAYLTLQVNYPWARFFSVFPSPLYAKFNANLVAGVGARVSEMNDELKEYTQNALTLLDEVRQFFIEKGAPDWDSNDWIVEPISPHLNLFLGPKELSFEKEKGFKPFPDTFFRLEHTIDDSSVQHDFQVPESLRNLPGKLIYFSLGTIASANPNILNRVIECLAKSPHRFIVSMGFLHDKVKLYPNMWGAKFVNQKAILPKVDLFITHGGHNSTIEAFHYGVPRLIVMPVFGDQFDCAIRVEECGFGRVINPFDFQEQHLLDTIETLLSDESAAEQMKTISSRLRSIKYFELAADKLEQLMNDYHK